MALPFVLDEDTRASDLWRAIQLHNSTSPAEAIDVVRVGDPDGPPSGASDPAIIAWAHNHGRIVVSHDKNTLIGHHEAFVTDGNTTPGLFIVQRGHSVSRLVEFLVLVGHCGEPHEYASRTQWVPEK